MKSVLEVNRCYWNCAIRQIIYDVLSVCHCTYSSILHSLRYIWRWRISCPWNES